MKKIEDQNSTTMTVRLSVESKELMKWQPIEMAKKKKLCEICGENPATVPDRERMGRLINRVCSSCHALRLAGDMKLIFELHERRRQAQLGHNAPHERTAFGGALENTVMQED
jgi:hypothetical protein